MALSEANQCIEVLERSIFRRDDNDLRKYTEPKSKKNEYFST